MSVRECVCLARILTHIKILHAGPLQLKTTRGHHQEKVGQTKTFILLHVAKRIKLKTNI